MGNESFRGRGKRMLSNRADARFEACEVFCKFNVSPMTQSLVDVETSVEVGRLCIACPVLSNFDQKFLYTDLGCKLKSMALFSDLSPMKPYIFVAAGVTASSTRAIFVGYSGPGSLACA